jgi:hypothetical protein
MHESDRNRLLKRQRALLLAAADMDQAMAAAQALEAESHEVALMRALETAVVVCYARAFTTSSLVRLDAVAYAPTIERLTNLHDDLLKARDRVYAHTDKASGRSASIEVISATGLGNLAGLPVGFGFEARESWLPFPREAIADAVSLFETQRERFRREAAELELRLSDRLVHH